MTQKIIPSQVDETSVTVNSSSLQDYAHLDDHIPPTYEQIPEFKPFTVVDISRAHKCSYRTVIQKLLRVLI